jgi:hypothetical protein
VAASADAAALVVEAVVDVAAAVVVAVKVLATASDSDRVPATYLNPMKPVAGEVTCVRPHPALCRDGAGLFCTWTAIRVRQRLVIRHEVC